MRADKPEVVTGKTPPDADEIEFPLLRSMVKFPVGLLTVLPAAGLSDQ